MQRGAIRGPTRKYVIAGILSMLAALHWGCPISDPPDVPGNGDPPPGNPVRIDATWFGNGTVEQEANGSLVTLRAIPDEGWEFTGWSDANVPNEETITVDAAEVPSIAATFVLSAGSECGTDADCDDGVFCNGTETCDDATCVTGVDPCAASETCDEDNAGCVADRDGDGVRDDTDNCPDDANPTQADTDEDGVADACDNCPGDANPEQKDDDRDGVGDLCADDRDGDDILNEEDNCPEESNTDQTDTDEDGLGDACDACPNDAENDADQDEVCDDVDQCLGTPPQTDVDGTGCPVNDPPDTECGNGLIEGGEACDPPDGIDCDNNCQTVVAGTPFCGDGTQDEGEECDDGNSTPCDGCDAACRLEEVPNDCCSNPNPVGDGETEFNTGGATTDGPPEEACNFPFDDHQIGSDIWYCYQATCDGEAVVSLCDSEYDTKLAVYADCECPTADPIECSDDDCGVGLESRVTFQAQAGESYLIRIGGFGGERGSGALNILCGEEVCGPGSGQCTSANDTRGCDDAECCAATCAVDPFCCDVQWDEFCAGEFPGLCANSFEQCAPDAGSCARADEENAGGCNQVECCNMVCMEDPFCCIRTWDESCARAAMGTSCFLTCGGEGGCFTARESPGCQDPTCCRAVCTQDATCCEDVWDETCADIAAETCR